MRGSMLLQRRTCPFEAAAVQQQQQQQQQQRWKEAMERKKEARTIN